ncbi:MAG: hypothetical protein ACI95T_001502 [Flavobacteriales bacterium]|jgi:hypothetical protein
MNTTSSTHIIRKAIWLSLFALILNCKKDENFIGTEIQNEDINVSKIDNFTIQTYTTLADSLRADEISISTLGSMNDMVMGKTNSSFFTQLRLPVDNVNFSGAGPLTSIVLDSVVLSLEYKDHYGSLDAQTFEVFQVGQDIEIDSAYYNGKSFTNLGTDLVKAGTQTQIPDPSSTVYANGDTLPAQLRIKLDNSFGQSILNESGNSTLSDNESFAQFMKGIEVKANNPGQATGEGAILLFDLLSVNSKVTLYYRDTATKDTTSFDLLINTYASRVNLNKHDYTGTQVDAQISDSTLGQNEVYIQGLQGVKTEVNFDDILRLRDSGIIINKAVLTMPVDFTTGNSFEPNPQLLVIRNEEGNKFLIPDQTMFAGTAGLANVGGEWNEDDSQYEFVITRYINNILNGKFPNNNLTLETVSSMVTPNRAVFFGHNSVMNKPKLTITYTKY